MKKTKSRILSLLLALVLVMSLLPSTALAAGEDKYIDKNGAEQTAPTPTQITTATTTLATGWYYVTGTVSIAGTLTVSGDAKLILCDDAVLTVTGANGADNPGGNGEPGNPGITIDASASLTLYGQTVGSGVLNVTGGGGGYGGGGGSGGGGIANSGALSVYGGALNATGGTGGVGGDPLSGGGAGGKGVTNSGTLSVYGGVLNATGGKGGDGAGVAGGGGDGIDGDGSGTITLTGGALTAACGAHGDGGNTTTGGGITGFETLTVSGGALTATSNDATAVIGENIAISGGSVTITATGSNAIQYNASLNISGGTVDIKAGKIRTYAAPPPPAKITGGSLKLASGSGFFISLDPAAPVNGTSATVYLTTVTVTDGATPVADATVTSGSYTAQTDSEGKAYCWLPAGATSIAASADTFNGGTGNLTVSDSAVNALTIALAAGSIPYINESGNPAQSGANPTQITTATTTLTDGWYYVTGAVSIAGTLTVSGDAKLILCDDAVLTVTGANGANNPSGDGSPGNPGITIDASASLTLYRQSGGTGVLNVTGGGGGTGALTATGGTGGSGIANSGTLSVYGGVLNVTGGGGGGGDDSYDGGSGGSGIANSGTLSVYGGALNATGGGGGVSYSGGGGAGGKGVTNSGTLSVYGGVLNGTGGKGGPTSGGGGGDGIDGDGSGFGFGFDGTITLSGGALTAACGAHGDGDNTTTGVGIRGFETLTVTGGALTATSNGATAVIGENIAIRGGSVTITATGSNAIQYNASLELSGGMVDIKAGNIRTVAVSPPPAKITGGSIKLATGSSFNPAPTSNGTILVYLTELTLSGVSTPTAITAITAPAGYGITNVKTDAAGKLYFWLPEGNQPIALTAGGKTYTGTVINNAATTLNVPIPLTVSAATLQTKTYDGNTSATVGTVTFGGGTPILNTDYTVTGTYSSANAGTTTGSVTVTLTAAGAAKYTLAQPTFNSATGNITKATGLTVTAPGNLLIGVSETAAKIFDLSTIGLNKTNAGTLSFALAPGGFTNGSNVLAAAPTLSDTNNKILNYTGNGQTSGAATQVITVSSTNYADTTVTITFEAVDKTPVTISGLSFTDRPYNGSAITPTGTVSSGAYTGTLEYSYSGRDGTVYSPVAGAPSAAGKYTLTVSVPASNATYIGSKTYDFEITKAQLTLVADNKSITTGGTLPSYTYSVTGLVAPDVKATVMDSEPTIDCPTANAAAAGSYPITITGGTLNTAAEANYEIATRTPASLTVSAPSYNGGGGTPASTPSNVISAPTTDTGWKDAAAKIKDGADVTINMGSTTAVPASFLAGIAGKDVDVTFNMGGGLSWTVNGTDIPSGSQSALNLGVSTGTSYIPATVRNIDGSVSEVQLRLSHDGAFAFDLVLSVPLDKQNAGHFANLYYYNAATGKLEFKQAVKIAADGAAAFLFDHASDYLIVVSAESMAWANPFTDIKTSDWFYGDVEYAVENGLFNGTSATTFSPNLPMTRAMVVTVLWRLEGSPEVEGMYAQHMMDVAQPSWYADAMGWAAKNNIISGYGEGFYGPDDSVTREQLAVILYRYAGSPALTTGQLEFADTENVSDWAVDAMIWATTEGIITGKPGNLLDPAGMATRAEVAAMLHRFAEASK